MEDYNFTTTETLLKVLFGVGSNSILKIPRKKYNKVKFKFKH